MIKKLAAVATVLALGFGGAIAIAGPANAIPITVITPGWSWEGVQDSSYLEDVNSYYPNYAGSGHDIYGWSGDSFDGFLDSFAMTYTPASPAAAVTIHPVFTTQSANVVDNGLTQIYATATADFGSGITVAVERALEIEGSYARWTFVFSADPALLAQVTAYTTGNLGADSNAHYILAGVNALVSTDSYNTTPPPISDGGDTIVGYKLSADAGAFTVADGNDEMGIGFATTSTAVLVAAFQDWNPCGYQAAIDAMTAAAPTLDTTFGGGIPSAEPQNCVLVASPAPVMSGTAIDQVLPITESTDLAPLNYLNQYQAPLYLKAQLLDAPSGLVGTLQFDPISGAPSLHLTGTVPSGSTTVHALFYYDYTAQEGGNGVLQQPLVSTFTLIGPALAATGATSTPTPILIAGGVLGVLGVTLVLLAQRRRWAR